MEKDSFYVIVTFFTTKSYNSRKGISTMKADIIIDHDTQKVKLIFDCAAGKVVEHLTSDEAENITKLVEQAAQNAWS